MFREIEHVNLNRASTARPAHKAQSTKPLHPMFVPLRNGHWLLLGEAEHLSDPESQQHKTLPFDLERDLWHVLRSAHLIGWLVQLMQIDSDTARNCTHTLLGPISENGTVHSIHTLSNPDLAPIVLAVSRPVQLLSIGQPSLPSLSLLSICLVPDHPFTANASNTTIYMYLPLDHGVTALRTRPTLAMTRKGADEYVARLTYNLHIEHGGFVTASRPAQGRCLLRDKRW